ncbi:MAG: MFS transporter [Lachnospiraceae bacterium]|nr:MFS transporter [Lachnospiraceae bacterium]
MSKKWNRWTYAVVGVLVLLMAGLVYAWSVISTPIAAYFPEWTKAQLSLTFTICMFFFCIGGFAGGMLNGKIPAKLTVWISAVCFFLGFLIASRANSTTMLYLGYGVCCGFASGLVYNAVMSTMLGWFPDKQGMVSGILLFGFGFSSFIVGKIYQAVTPSGVGVAAWRTTFVMFGVILLIAIAVCGFFFVKPMPEDLAGLAVQKSEGMRKAVGIEAAPLEMVKDFSFWLYFAWAVLLSAAGLALISQASGVAGEVGPEVNPGTIATVVGLISICNGFGRLFFGGLYDKAGRMATMSLITLSFMLSVGVIILALTVKSFALIVVGFICTGFSYGGVNPMNSAVIRSYWGSKNYPVNFSIINMNLLLSSFGSTIAGMLYDRSGSFLSTFIAMIGAAAVGMVCNVLIREPKAKN